MRTSELVIWHRERAGLSRPQLAELSGIPARTLEKIEQGVVAEPKLADVVKIAGALGLTCADFVANDVPSPPPPPVGRPPKAKPDQAPAKGRRKK